MNFNGEYYFNVLNLGDFSMNFNELFQRAYILSNLNLLLYLIEFNYYSFNVWNEWHELLELDHFDDVEIMPKNIVSNLIIG